MADARGTSPRPPASRLDALVASTGLDRLELLTKAGRSRRLELVVAPGGGLARRAGFHRETGWALRAGDDRRSLFAAGIGEVPEAGPWPEADGLGLELASPPGPPGSSGGGEAWREPADFDAPLVGEREGFGLLDALARAVEDELDGARLVAARLDDGFAEVAIASTAGVAASHRTRAAFLRFEAAVGECAAALEVGEREARRVDPRALARRLADRLAVARDGEPPERDRAAMVLAPPVARRLLLGLAPLFLGPGAEERAEALADERSGAFAAPALTVVDDGRLPGGLLEAPVDGIGLPTRAVTLVDGGAYRQPLVPWPGSLPRTATAGGRPGARVRPSGCMRRPSWRDRPSVGPTHLHVVPDRERSAAALVADLARGYYLLEATGRGRFDLDGDRFALPVAGFSLRAVRPALPVAGGWLVGGIGSLLRGIEAVGRDLEFEAAAGGMVGSPSLLVNGLEIRDRPPPG